MSYSPSIRLDRFTTADIPELVSWVPDAKFLLQFSGPTYTFETFAEQLLSDIHRMETKGNIRLYRAVDTESQQSVGHLQLMNIDQIHGKAWIGRVLVGNVGKRDSGIGTAMMKALLHIAFGELKLREVGLSVYDFNHAAIRCYEQLGFQEYERQTVFQEKAGEEWTTIRMKLRREEPGPFLRSTDQG